MDRRIPECGSMTLGTQTFPHAVPTREQVAQLRREAPALDALSARQRLDALQRDQARRWRAGQRVGVEAYRQAFPFLAGDDDGLMDLLYNEARLRIEQGEPVGLAEYLARFPELSEPLQRQFEVMELVRTSSTAVEQFVNQGPGSASSLTSSSSVPSATPTRSGSILSGAAMDPFRDRVILITGAGSGIGRQLALTLARMGARIAAVDISGDGLDRLRADLAGKSHASAVADVTELEALRAATRSLEATLGPTDVLIANAGIGRETSALSFKAEDINAQLQVNLIGVVNSIDAVLAGMRQRRRGHLVAISSLASFHGIPRMAGYCASKAGVNALMDSLRVELRPLGIDCTTVCPGWIRTPLTEPINLPAHMLMSVEEAALRIVSAIRARKRFVAFPAGSAWQVRLLRHLPAGLADWLARRFMERAARLPQAAGASLRAPAAETDKVQGG